VLNETYALKAATNKPTVCMENVEKVAISLLNNKLAKTRLIFRNPIAFEDSKSFFAKLDAEMIESAILSMERESKKQ
jgi:hypothetical protein